MQIVIALIIISISLYSTINDFNSVTEKILKHTEGKAPKEWTIAFLASLAVLSIFGAMIGYLVWEGTGVWGVNNPVGWGFAMMRRR